MKTDEVCGRPLNSFAFTLWMLLGFYTISKFTCAICLRLFRSVVRSFHLA